MKDFYYILGLEISATKEEITKSYRKLSLRFHPDTNNGDSFFSDRFRELKEAYETLINDVSRKEYDLRLKKYQNQAKNNAHPEIIEFECNKNEAAIGEGVILKWITIGSETVNISYIGNVESIGESNLIIPNICERLINITITSENTTLRKKAAKTISIKNSTFENIEKFALEKFKSDLLSKKQTIVFGQVINNHIVFWLSYIFSISFIFSTVSVAFYLTGEINNKTVYGINILICIISILVLYYYIDNYKRLK